MNLNKNSIRRLIILLLLLLLAVFVLYINYEYQLVLDNEMYNYYIENSIEETGLLNRVSSIYLGYRVFDTLFEALLLAISVTAIVYFAEPWDKDEEL